VGLLLSVHVLHCFFVAGISGIENVYIQFYSHDVHYRILRTIGQYFFSSTRWLRPVVHIDLYKDAVKKMTILFTVHLEFAVGFFSE
jgi:hypothetical protein